jgi:hypothetical protein
VDRASAGCGDACEASAAYDLLSPGAAYYAFVVLGPAAAPGIIVSALPLLKRITGPEAARNGADVPLLTVPDISAG